MMTENSAFELRRKLEQVESSGKQWKELMEKRVDLESSIEHAEENLASARQTMHQQGKLDENHLEAERKIIEDLKGKKHMIDSILDSIEEQSEVMVEYLQEELAEAMIQEQPQLKEEYEARKKRIDSLKVKKETIREIRGFLEELLKLLAVISHERGVVKKRGVLGFIFRSPNMAIEQSIKGLEAKIKKDKPSRLPPELDKLINELGKIGDDGWGYKKIDQLYLPAFEKLESSYEELSAEEHRLSEELDSEEKKFRTWLG